MRKYIFIISIIFLISFASATTDDTYTTSLLHFDTVGGSTTFTDENPLNIWTPHHGLTINGEGDPTWGNNVHFETGDYIDSQPSTAFILGTGNWTFDTRIRYDSNGDPAQRIMGMGKYGTGYRSAKLHTANIIGTKGLEITFYQGIVTLGDYYHHFAAGEYNTNQWYHLQISRCGVDGSGYANMLIFIDGVKYDMTGIAYMTGATNLGDMKNMTLGTNDFSHFPTLYLDGSLDETRFSAGICRNTESFTPPVYPYPSTPTSTYYELSMSKAPLVAIASLFILLVSILIFAYSQKRRTNV